MSSVRGILERASLDSMIACLLDEPGPVNQQSLITIQANPRLYAAAVRKCSRSVLNPAPEAV